jgi:parallel beta-helix repeat protein
MRRIRFALAAVALTATLSVGLAGSALAKNAGPTDVIEVFPGPNAIRNALDVAQPGDILNIHAGTYPEQVSVDVPEVTLQSAGDGVVTIDGECTAFVTLNVSAERVTIRGLRVIGAGAGGAPMAIDFSLVDIGRAQANTVEDTCGDAWYGINVYAGGSIKIQRNVTSGFDDAGIYVGDITSTPFGPMVIRGNETFGNTKGVIVQDISGATVRVIANTVHDNDTTGIWLNRADGVRVERNNVRDNQDRGIEADADSDGNMIIGNRSLGHTFDLYDGGGGNCWMDNVYVTSFGDISC